MYMLYIDKGMVDIKEKLDNTPDHMSNRRLIIYTYYSFKNNAHN